jgi:hypothetical protein
MREDGRMLLAAGRITTRQVNICTYQLCFLSNFIKWQIFFETVASCTGILNASIPENRSLLQFVFFLPQAFKMMYAVVYVLPTEVCNY